MAHALATDAGEGDFHAASIANHALVLNALVFATGAFPVPSRTKDALTEKATLFWFEGPIVDRFRVFDLATRPGSDGFRCGDGDADLIKAHRPFLAH